MSTLGSITPEEDEVFAAFALGEAKRWITTHSEDLGHGNTALVSHGVTIALRSEDTVVFDAAPHRDGERCVCRVVAHVGRAGVHVHEHFADDEVHAFDHASFVELASRLRCRGAREREAGRTQAAGLLASAGVAA